MALRRMGGQLGHHELGEAGGTGSERVHQYSLHLVLVRAYGIDDARITGIGSAFEAMEFIAPIHLRDLISVYAQVERVGRTSMGVRIEVVAHRDLGATEVKVTDGLFTFVALDMNNRPRAVDQSGSGAIA